MSCPPSFFPRIQSSFLGSPTRWHQRFWLLLGLFASTVLLSLLSIPFWPWHDSVTALESAVAVELCDDQTYSSGSWQTRSSGTSQTVTDWNSLLSSLNITKCAADWGQNNFMFAIREGVEARSKRNQFEWATSCTLFKPSAQQKLQWLLNTGGVLLVGDSLTQQHFFQISCELGEHLIYSVENATNWPLVMHLHLNIESPLVQRLRLPANLDVQATPLFTLVRSDFLANVSRIHSVTDNLQFATALDAGTHVHAGTEAYLWRFHQPLPRYSTLLLSTGSHWTEQIFATNLSNVVTYVQPVMRDLAQEVSQKMRPDQRVFFRAASSGHACEEANLQPLQTLEPPPARYNWHYIPFARFLDMMNKLTPRSYINYAVKELVRTLRHPQIQYMDVERPGRLRPEAHTTDSTDCLHFAVGTGVLEGWSEYLWHAVLLNGETRFKSMSHSRNSIGLPL